MAVLALSLAVFFLLLPPVLAHAGHDDVTLYLYALVDELWQIAADAQCGAGLAGMLALDCRLSAVWQAVVRTITDDRMEYMTRPMSASSILCELGRALEATGPDPEWSLRNVELVAKLHADISVNRLSAPHKLYCSRV